MSSTKDRTLWDPTSNYQRIGLKNLTVEMHVGIADWERRPDQKQRVVVGVELYSHKDVHQGRDISDCINYDTIHDYVTQSWPNRPHTDLLETLAEELVGVCFRDARVEACRVTLEKPDVYSDTDAAFVEFYRVRQKPQK